MGHQFSLTFDAANPSAQATFWAFALGYIVQPPPEGFATWDEFADSRKIPQDQRDNYGAIVDPDGVGPRILFLKVPEEKTAKNRVHLDVLVTGEPGTVKGDMAEAMLLAKAEELMAIGASMVGPRSDHSSRWVVMGDPEGNEFCIV